MPTYMRDCSIGQVGYAEDPIFTSWHNERIVLKLSVFLRARHQCHDYSQAFNVKDMRRISLKLDEFRSCRSIDIIAKMDPILIIDEPQSVERINPFHGFYADIAAI